MTAPLFMTGLGVYLPRAMVTNALLPALNPPMSVTDMDRVGILRRGIATDDESVCVMAVSAANRALEEAQISANSLDFLILANWTERRYVPDFAPRVQHALGATRAFAFDICCACCGFLYGLSLAHGYLQNPNLRRGLVIASDRSTRHIRPKSRGTLVFGDAAAAVVVERDAPRGAKLLDYELYTNGAQNGIMDLDADGFLVSHIRQRDLNELAGRSIAGVSRALLDRNGLSLDDVAWIIPHSGTAGVQAMVREALGVPVQKVLTNLPEIGNVTTASIPAALQHFKQLGTVRPGDLVLSASVGLGWQAAAILYNA
jgi:3-oxoacyl-[acyl-carrier-protein] synthase-3